jgi:hypothetical protein
MKAASPQSPIEPLIAHFERMLALTDDEKQLLASKFQSRLYRKRQFVLQEGDVCNVFNFVVSGVFAHV